MAGCHVLAEGFFSGKEKLATLRPPCAQAWSVLVRTKTMFIQLDELRATAFFGIVLCLPLVCWAILPPIIILLLIVIMVTIECCGRMT